MEIDIDNVLYNLRNNKYRFIGSGTGRRVFDMADGFVVKVAKNKKGIAQNQAEYQIISASQSSLFANILAVTTDFEFLFMEKTEPVKRMSEVWAFFNVDSNSKLFQLEELNDLAYKYDLVLQDLCSPTSWGKINDRYVIIDYGFTRSVRNRYYRR